jgi:hypothetical protein
MNRRFFLTALGGLALCPVCAPAGFAADNAHPHWSYEGASGPTAWGNLDAANKVCSIGAQQSPIELGGAIKAQVEKLDIQWKRGADTIVNNGHTIQLNFSPGSTLTLGKGRFDLLQMHFHRPSEHTIGGKNFPMELSRPRECAVDHRDRILNTIDRGERAETRPFLLAEQHLIEHVEPVERNARLAVLGRLLVIEERLAAADLVDDILNVFGGRVRGELRKRVAQVGKRRALAFGRLTEFLFWQHEIADNN